MGIMGMSLKFMAKAGKKVSEELEETTKRPGQCQLDTLMQIIRDNQDSEYGKKYAFSQITSIEDFKKRVPISDFDTYAKEIERMAEGEQNILTSEKIIHFNETSGTVGIPKRIPVSQKHISAFSRYMAQYLNYLAVKNFGDDWIKGKGLSLTEGTFVTLPSGITCGCASSIMASRMQFGPFKDLMFGLYTSPLEARSPHPDTTPRYLHARFALMEENVTYANATFSSYLLEIMRYIEMNWEMLLHDIETGEFSDAVTIPDEVKASLKSKCRPMPERARQLRRIFEKGFGEPFVPKVWPKLTYTICVGGACFADYTKRLKERYFGDDIKFLYLGLSSSEGLYSMPTKPDSFDAVFIPDFVFMEFLPLGADINSETLTIEQLEVGGKYELIITNRNGLYRYRLKDAVEITGFYNNTPTMQFLYRVDNMINMFAEKTTEKALSWTANEAAKDTGVGIYDYSVYPDADSYPARYVFLMELDQEYTNLSELQEKMKVNIDRRIKEANPVMKEVMDEGSCTTADVYFLQQETYMLYRDLMIMKGRSATQLKPVHIIRNEVQRKFFFGLREIMN